MGQLLSMRPQSFADRTLESRDIWLLHDLWLTDSSEGRGLVRPHAGALGLVEPQAQGAGELDGLPVHALVESVADGFIDVVEISIGSVASPVDAFLGLLNKFPFLAVYVERIVAAPVTAVGVVVFV